MNNLNVPFSKASSLGLSTASKPNSLPSLIHPASIRDGDTLLLPSQDLNRFLTLELRTSKLDKILPHLWLAGLPRSARSLHRQNLIGRTILITEDPNEHLVWVESRIFIKPLPEFLLDWEFWIEHLCVDTEFYRCACGLLLSYAWLVAYQSDLRIAKKIGLLPEHVEWRAWTTFMGSFLERVNFETLDFVAERYKFGELRLTRLNSLYRFTSLSLHHFVRGYMSSSTWYKAFFTRNFAWLLAVFAYVTVMLSAMQVGLSTTRLQVSEAFQKGSYGFAVASIVAVLGSVVVILFVWAGLFVYHLVSTRNYYRVIARKRLILRENLFKGEDSGGRERGSR